MENTTKNPGQTIEEKAIEKSSICENFGKRRRKETKRQKYERLCARLNEAKRGIDLAETPEDATKALSDLALLVVTAKNISEYEDVMQLLNDLDELLISIRNYHKTRHELELMLQLLLKRLNDLIDLERKAECANIVKKLFLEFSKNSDVIAQTIKLDQLLE